MGFTEEEMEYIKAMNAALDNMGVDKLKAWWVFGVLAYYLLKSPNFEKLKNLPMRAGWGDKNLIVSIK